MKLSILIPTFNEQRTIQEIVDAIEAVPFPIGHEIIIIDDASTDRTVEKLTIARLREARPHIQILRNPVNRGKGFSIRKGIEKASGELLIVQDADDEYDPRDIPRLIEPILKGEASVVYGSRFMKSFYPKGMALPNWAANRLLTWLTNLLFGLRLSDMETCYKAFRADLIKNLPLKSDRFEFEPEVTALLARAGHPITELPIGYSGRTAKKGKKIRAKDFFIACFTLIRCRFFK